MGSSANTKTAKSLRRRFLHAGTFFTSEFIIIFLTHHVQNTADVFAKSGLPFFLSHKSNHPLLSSLLLQSAHSILCRFVTKRHIRGRISIVLFHNKTIFYITIPCHIPCILCIISPCSDFQSCLLPIYSSLAYYLL